MSTETCSENRTSVPDRYLEQGRTSFAMLMSLFLEGPRNATGLILRHLPRNDIMPAMLSCIEAFVWVLETELPRVVFTEASPMEHRAFAIQQGLRLQDGNREYALSHALEITTALFAGIFPTIADSPGFPHPCPTEGEWERTWEHAVNNEGVLESLSQEQFGMSLSELRTRLSEIAERMRTVTGKRFFADEQSAEKCYALWRTQCFQLFERSWPVFIHWDWAMEVVTSGSVADNVIRNFEFMAALGSLAASKARSQTASISTRLREFIGVSSDSTSDPEWYVDEPDGVVSRRVAIWEVVIGLDGLDDEAEG